MIEGDFLYLPGSSPGTGELLTLGKGSGTFQTNSFVVVPYTEPRLQPPSPLFFPVLYRKAYRLEKIPLPNLTVRCTQRRDSYIDTVRRLKAHIQRGDIYEINYCIKFEAFPQPDPFTVFVQLCEVSRAPYQMLARIGGQYILCASPELYLRKRSDLLFTKPIKGTIRRGATADDDDQLRETLYNSLKDRTENVMAVDVARNDLSMLATRGSVEVNKLYNIESFETVHQMVSTVSCRLRPEIGFTHIINATFPMASMTGAPKYRAMQLIGETEKFERSYYSGTMGLIAADGDFDLPVLIRSLFVGPDKTWFATGGAITHLSDPAQEYEECLLKASTMLRALNATFER